MKTDNAKLIIDNVSVGYGGDSIVQNVSFDVAGGELCSLLGLNGSGKTTLLKGICGLLPTQSGSVSYNGTDLLHLGDKKRAQLVSFIPQRHSKLIGVTVTDAVLMGLNATLGTFDSYTQADKSRAVQALEIQKISLLADDDFSHLSEGQKQLVILARSLLQNTPVMLMDEPDSSLDFPNKHMVLGCVRDMVHNDKKACIITLHDPHLALKYCDKLILLDKGKVASTLDLREANKDEIENCLAVIYGTNIFSK